MEELAPSYTIGGIYNDAATLENSLAVPQPVNHRFKHLNQQIPS